MIRSESLMPATSFIKPTSMGIAFLYPTELIDDTIGNRLKCHPHQDLPLTQPHKVS